MRLHLTLAIITALALVITLRANVRHPFTFAHLQEMAQKRAQAKYVPPPDVLPPQLKKLTPAQDAGIFWKDTYRLWRKKGLPFQVDFYPQLNSNPSPHIALQVNAVDRKGSHPLAYSPLYFNFLNLSTHPATPLVFDPPLPDNLGYAGFYLRYPDMGIHSNANSLDGFFTAMGGSYVRAMAKDQVYGLSARGLAIDSFVPNKPEEFPLFTDWWLQEPQPNATSLVLDAMLDSPSVAGAYEFTVSPGGVTSVDVHASLYFRLGVDQLGVAPFSSMYLFGENSKDHFGDAVHPEIHDSDGVLIHTRAGEWEWHPLQQAPFLQTYSFYDENPQGFGLIQRDRDFQHYQDLQALYNVRPSAWVTPHDNWGKGHVELIQLNSNNFNTDNVVLFWSPDRPVKAGDQLDVNYTVDYYMNDANLPPLSYCKQTLINCPAPAAATPPAVAPATIPVNPPPKVASTLPETKPSKPAAAPTTNAPAFVGPPTGPSGPPPIPIPVGTVPVQFLIDFVGDGIENIPPNQPPDLDLSYDPPGTYLREKSVQKNGYDNSWRVTFTIIPFKHFTPTKIRCRLLQNNKPITETWVYTWHQ
jgi:periplasmic glucans biosynthesis protein